MTIKLHVARFEHFGQAYIFLHKMIFIYCYSDKGILQYCDVLQKKKKNVPYKVRSWNCTRKKNVCKKSYQPIKNTRKTEAPTLMLVSIFYTL